VFTSIYQVKSSYINIHLKKHKKEYAEMMTKKEEWKLQIKHKNEQFREEINKRKTEFSKYKCKDCNYTGMSQKNLELNEKKGIHKEVAKIRGTKKSYTWDYYGKDKDDPMVAICNLCGNRMRMGKVGGIKGSTGHMSFHLETKHVDSYNSLKLKEMEDILQKKMKFTNKNKGEKRFKCNMFNCTSQRALLNR
jgi:transposase-like protein